MMSEDPWKWLDQPSQWDAVVKACYERKVVGLDTETYGHNVKTSTPAFRAIIDVWSLALATRELHPRGYHVARACVLPLAALLYPPMTHMLESQDIIHVFHNTHHDEHAMLNHGVKLGRSYDTLDAVRLLWPGMDEGYSLKPVRQKLLGKPEREKFKDLTSPLETQYADYIDVIHCSCGQDKCRKTEKKWGAAHTKTAAVEIVTKTKKEPCSIESIVPGHPRWLRKLQYSGDDAADGLELYEVVQMRLVHLKDKFPPLPWETKSE